VVFAAVGETMHALDAVTGEEIWRFVAGTGCVDGLGDPPGLCAFDGERNQVETSPIVVDGKVFFGMDVNEGVTGTGGFYAVDATDGRMEWFFDLETGSTCVPDASTNPSSWLQRGRAGARRLPCGASGCSPIARRQAAATSGRRRRRQGRGLVFGSSNWDRRRPLTRGRARPCPTSTRRSSLSTSARRPGGAPRVDSDDFAWRPAPLYDRARGEPSTSSGSAADLPYVLDRDGVSGSRRASAHGRARLALLGHVIERRAGWVSARRPSTRRVASHRHGSGTGERMRGSGGSCLDRDDGEVIWTTSRMAFSGRCVRPRQGDARARLREQRPDPVLRGWRRAAAPLGAGGRSLRRVRLERSRGRHAARWNGNRRPQRNWRRQEMCPPPLEPRRALRAGRQGLPKAPVGLSRSSGRAVYRASLAPTRNHEGIHP
jgi:hypothetical protein